MQSPYMQFVQHEGWVACAMRLYIKEVKWNEKYDLHSHILALSQKVADTSTAAFFLLNICMR